VEEVRRIQETGRYWTEGSEKRPPLSAQGRAIDVRLRANMDKLKRPATAPEDIPQATTTTPARAPEDGPAPQPKAHTAPPKPAPSALEDEFAELAELVGGKAGQLAKEAAAQLRAATAAKEAAALLRGAGLDDLAGGFADLAKMMS
jgi:hypothetical protein